MVIDIISFTDEQFAELSAEQLLEVKNVQLKKNRLTQQLEEDKRKEKYRLLTAGIFRSPIYAEICDRLDGTYSQEVENLREGLLFYLRFSSRPSGGSDETTGYPLDYSLSYDDRYDVVREYYNETYDTAEERFNAFSADKIAVSYLGEYYSVLFNYFYAQAN